MSPSGLRGMTRLRLPGIPSPTPCAATFWGCAGTLCFEGKRLNQIAADDLRAYQAERLGMGKNPNTIKHEVKALMRLLKRAMRIPGQGGH